MLDEVDGQVAQDLETPLYGIEKEYVLFNQMQFNWLLYRTTFSSEFRLFQGEFDSNSPGKGMLRSYRSKLVG